MSTSWKVVRRAYVFWESFNLWPTLCLNLDIGSRVYFLSPENTGGGGGGGVDLGLSALAASLGASFFGAYWVWVCAVLDDWAGLDSSFFSAGWDAPSGFLASTSTPNRGFPTGTVSPGAAYSLVRIPGAGLLISTVTLSVSTLAIVSSCSTHSPSFLVKSAIIPSVMESAISGRGKTFSIWGRKYRQSDRRGEMRGEWFYGERGVSFPVWRYDGQSASSWSNSIQLIKFITYLISIAIKSNENRNLFSALSLHDSLSFSKECEEWERQQLKYCGPLLWFFLKNGLDEMNSERMKTIDIGQFSLIYTYNSLHDRFPVHTFKGSSS